MLHMKEAEASIFAFNEAPGDDINVRNNPLLAKSKNRVFNQEDGHYCQIVTSTSQTPVISFTKPGGNIMGQTGPFVERIQQRLEDKLSGWYGLFYAERII